MKLGKKLGLLAVGCFIALLAVFLVLRQSVDDLSSALPALEAKAEDLRATQISAVMDVPIQRGTNLLWCGTFQLAWNEATTFLGEDLSFAEDVPLAAVLNRQEFSRNDLDETSYVAVGGFPTSDTLDRLRNEVRRKFGPGFDPHLIPQTNADLALFFYACLFKNLAFEKEFQRIEHPLQFGTNKVAAFGIQRPYPYPTPLWQQVRLLDYRNTNDFIIELKTKSETDVLILAKVPSQKTLVETVKAVRQRAEGESSKEVEVLKLLIPKTDFILTRTYDELAGRHLTLKKNGRWNGYSVVDAKQIIRFRLDEKGALLKSKAELPVTAAIPPESADLIFDRPFLVLLQRVGARAPYFALWIDNAELLVPWNSGSAVTGVSETRR